MIKAAIFDLDGTLLDSVYVWSKVDREFFACRGMDVPEDYARAISGMSYRATAVYTKERFELPESIEEIENEWTATALNEYTNHVQLKKGAYNSLVNLKNQGVRLCVATSNRAELIMPCLRRCGVADMFEFILTTDEAGVTGKSDGELFRMCAERFGMEYKDCGVFDDTLSAIMGAKKLGMKAYCTIDPDSTHDLAIIEKLADSCAPTIPELLL